MKTIYDVLREKEEQLREAQRRVAMIEEQIEKLRGAIDVMKGDDGGEISAPEPPAPRQAVAVNATPSPTRNWP